MAIAVLLSAYNGQAYIRQQIDTILKQEGVELKLFIRDDGSDDATPAIIRKYEGSDNRIIFINRDHRTNIGIQKSFMSLLEFAYRNYDMEYFAFADQDDVWLPGKLQAAVNFLDNIENKKGKLVYTNKVFVDENLELIESEKIDVYNDYTELFWKSRAAGCTMLFDRKLTEYILRVKTKSELIHDSWIYRVAKSIGATVVFDENSYILYRQHGNNSVGLKSLYQYQYHESMWYWIKRFIPMLFEKRSHVLIDAMQEIYDNYYDDLTMEGEKIIRYYLKYRTNVIAKFKLIMNPDMKKRSRKDKMLWVYRVIFNWL